MVSLPGSQGSSRTNPKSIPVVTVVKQTVSYFSDQAQVLRNAPIRPSFHEYIAIRIVTIGKRGGHLAIPRGNQTDKIIGALSEDVSVNGRRD